MLESIGLQRVGHSLATEQQHDQYFILVSGGSQSVRDHHPSVLNPGRGGSRGLTLGCWGQLCVCCEDNCSKPDLFTSKIGTIT